MTASNEVRAVFECPLEHAFRTPIHGDATKILRGWGPVPPCVGFEEDETWGREGGTRIPVLAGNWLVKGGRTGLDKVLVRRDGEYWKWQVTDFGTWTLFFAKKAVGEWWVEEMEGGKVNVRWRYTYCASSALAQPFNWLFVRIAWRALMRRGMGYIKEMAEARVPFLYEK